MLVMWPKGQCVREALLVVAVFSALFSAGYQDVFGLLDGRDWQRAQEATEAWVFGRLVESEANGMFSSHGQLGRFIDPDTHPGSVARNQRLYFEGKIPLKGRYSGHTGSAGSGYNSQIGLHGEFFTVFNRMLSLLGVEAVTQIKVMHMAATALFAGILSFVLLILFREVGGCAVLFATLGTMASKWTGVYASNIYWLWGLMYLPMAVVFALSMRRNVDVEPRTGLLFGLVVLTVFLKCACGYEFTSTVLVATLAPLGYFAVANGWSLLFFVRRCTIVGLAGITGFLVTFGLHMLQLRSSLGSFDAGIKALKGRVLLRTSGDPGWVTNKVLGEAADSSVFEVIRMRWNFELTNLHDLWGVESPELLTFAHVFWATLICAALILLAAKFSKVAFEHRAASRGLMFAAFIASLAPLSWFIFGKAHSYVHWRECGALFHLPASLFCFALLGHGVGLMGLDLRRRLSPAKT